MILGRHFSAAEQDRNERVVVLNESLWPKVWSRSWHHRSQHSIKHDELHGRRRCPSASGSSCMGRSLDATLIDRADAAADATIPTARSGRSPEAWYDAGVAQAQMTSIAGRLASDDSLTNRDTSATVISLQDQMTSQVRPALLVAWLAVSLVLMVACANELTSC